MKSQWFSDLKGAEEISRFKDYVKNSSGVLDKLSNICYNKIQESEKVSFPDYDSPSWSHKQAHLNGYAQAMREIIELCTLTKEP